ncbi:MAG: TonB-dependent receptor [Flavobacteriaceae bacterium]|nr:TonB-dependent receptor [Flavobacteriaceae bacterium]
MRYYFTILCLFISQFFLGQTISGKITTNEGDAIPFANILVKELKKGAFSDENGFYKIENISGKITLEASYQGYRKTSKTLIVNSNIEVNFTLFEDQLGLEEVVVTATRNRVEKRKAPVVVSTIKPRLLQATQSLTIADGLNFAPGIRIETNCQNCGFTQIRLNGLTGGYTQILLNSRPVFTSLIGVYGLEQIPTNIIERIEVVRSGGSALYGSSAIAGTVNVITRDPILNTWEIGTNLALIGGSRVDKVLTFNNSIVADDLNSGVTFYGNYRNRNSYDANNDGFTELVELKNTTVGANAFIKPSKRSKISLNIATIQEYRRGGDKLDLAPQFTDITEELNHDTFIGGLSFEQFSKDNSNNFQAYTSVSNTSRDSYYGGLGGGRTKQDSITANNAFGNTKDIAWVNGLQFTKSLENNDVLTIGSEYNYTNTRDEIQGYNRLIDQTVNTLGIYAQYEWKPSEKFTTLIGARFDNVNVNGDYRIGGINRLVNVNQTAISPRLTMSYQLNNALKFRGGYARGFRAAQAFNEDLHISSVGGEQQFVILSNNLETEFSNAFTGSLNYSKNINLLQMDFLLEGFYTTLENPFTIVSTGAVLANGSILEEVRNGSGARVYGANFEFSLSPSPKWQLQLGGTLQKAKYDEPQIIFEADGSVPTETDVIINEFVRNPNFYGFFNISWIPNKKFNIDITGTYTGSMTIPRVISNTGFLQLNTSNAFFDVNLKLESHIDFSDSFMTTFSLGIRNMFNSYQDDFDIGAGRDSDYVYGPAAPRTFFIGLKFGKLH